MISPEGIALIFICVIAIGLALFAFRNDAPDELRADRHEEHQRHYSPKDWPEHYSQAVRAQKIAIFCAAASAVLLVWSAVMVEPLFTAENSNDWLWPILGVFSLMGLPMSLYQVIRFGAKRRALTRLMK